MNSKVDSTKTLSQKRATAQETHFSFVPFTFDPFASSPAGFFARIPAAVEHGRYTTKYINNNNK